MNNHRTHLEFEYQQLIESDGELALRTEKDADRVRHAADILDTCEKAAEIAKEHYERVVEQYRESHSESMNSRVKLGEMESELLLTAEE